MSTDQQNFAFARQYQEYYDQTLRRIGARAPAPLVGQSCTDYRRETLRQLKHTFLPQNHDLFKVQYRGLRSDALNVFEPQLLKAVEQEARNPANLEPGEIRPINVFGPDGQKWTDWIGQEHFTKAMGRPGRRVVSFTTDRGRFDASGRPLR
jgi:hypothetical protein